MEGQRFATKEEVLKNLKDMYKKKRLTYKQYMVEVNRTEKHYDEWKAQYDAANGGNNEIDMTNEELAIGKRLNDLQSKPVTVQEQEANVENEEIVDEQGEIITEEKLHTNETETKED
jgi:hypothetical protein